MRHERSAYGEKALPKALNRGWLTRNGVTKHQSNETERTKQEELQLKYRLGTVKSETVDEGLKYKRSYQKKVKVKKKQPSRGDERRTDEE